MWSADRFALEKFPKDYSAYLCRMNLHDLGQSFLPSIHTVGGPLLMSCRCMKTTTQSGQAWRGYERAQYMIIDELMF